VALLLGTIAIEVSPIATVLVLREANSEGPLTDAVYNILAWNNVACLVAFGIASLFVRLFAVTEGGLAPRFQHELVLFLWSNVGAVALGVVLGVCPGVVGRTRVRTCP
jgi:hypothetical protein